MRKLVLLFALVLSLPFVQPVHAATVAEYRDGGYVPCQCACVNWGDKAYCICLCAPQ